MLHFNGNTFNDFILLNVTCNSAVPELSFDFPWQQWSRERAMILRYTYIVCLFICMIRSFRRDVYDVFVLLGYYALLIGS